MCHNRISFPQGFPKEKQILHPLMLKIPLCIYPIPLTTQPTPKASLNK